jgi:glycosyltransferase involved in cell wall biosynthesis
MSALRVLLVHNAYRHAGGEDGVVAAELALLRGKGHEVIELRRDNDAIGGMSRLNLAAQTLWSGATHALALALLQRHRPAVVHVHNTLPLVSPSLYWACAKAGVPVVQTLHNFRLACPQAMFLREGKVCERCLGQAPWPALVHGCYRDSRAQTAVVAGMLMLHRGLGTFEHKVTRYIALNEFCRAKFIQAGLPAQRIAVKPNFADMARPPEGQARQGFLFVGRLSAEKGIETLGLAWQDCPGMQLRVIGSGTEVVWLDALPGIQLLGPKTAAQVQAAMRSAVALLLPSICYENFPRTLVEAFACGLPVIASRIGALAELVQDGQTGLLFEPGDAQDLGRTLRWAQAHPAEMAAMGARARARYEAHYTPDINYRQLLAIYHSAIDDSAPPSYCESAT